MADENYIQALTAKFASERQKQSDLADAYWRTSALEINPFTNHVGHLLGRGLVEPGIFNSPGMVPDEDAGTGQLAIQNAGDYLGSYLAGRGLGLGYGATRDNFRNYRNRPALGITPEQFKSAPLQDILSIATQRPSAVKGILNVLDLGDPTAASLAGRVGRTTHRAFAGQGIGLRAPWYQRFNPFLVPFNDAINAVMEQYGPTRPADDRITVKNIHPQADKEEKGKKGKAPKKVPLGTYANELANSIAEVGKSTPNVSIHSQNVAQRLLSLVPGGKHVGGIRQTNLDLRQSIAANQAAARQRLARRAGVAGVALNAVANVLDHNTPLAPATRGITEEEYNQLKNRRGWNN